MAIMSERSTVGHLGVPRIATVTNMIDTYIAASQTHHRTPALEDLVGTARESLHLVCGPRLLPHLHKYRAQLQREDILSSHRVWRQF